MLQVQSLFFMNLALYAGIVCNANTKRRAPIAEKNPLNKNGTRSGTLLKNFSPKDRNKMFHIPVRGNS